MFKEKTYVFFWLCFCHLVGVFADELKSVSVKEGDSVTLHINVTEIQTGDEIMWRFGSNGNLIAKTSGHFSKISIHDGPDGRFRDRLKLDNQTGSLTITNIRTEHAGDYEFEISSSNSETKLRFNVTVFATTTTKPPSTLHSPSGTSHTSDSPLRPSGSIILVIGISAAAAGFLLLAVSVGIFCICKKQRKTDQHVEAHEAEITYADPKFYKRNKPTVKQENEVVYAAVVTRR